MKTTPNNNFSVLPWYNSTTEQNARKWWHYGKIYPLFVPASTLIPFQLMRPHRSGGNFTFKVYTSNDEFVGDYSNAIRDLGLTVKEFPQFGYDVILYPARFPLFSQMFNGQYYAVLSDGTDTWYSEIYTAVNDSTPYLRIDWWDARDFIMDAGIIVYKEPAFKNVLYLQADIAKPEYVFEEEGETRDGYFFPIKQISEKRFRFSFLASEYLLDVMRFIRMSDYVKIYYRGQEYSADTFLITPEWEDEGDIATVEAEFDTATVAKKLPPVVLASGGGDFNNDYNNDFNNQ